MNTCGALHFSLRTLGCHDCALSAQFTITRIRFETLLKDHGELLCNCIEGCPARMMKRFKSFQGMYYHMQDHIDPQKTRCTFRGCGRMVITRRLAWHVKESHWRPQKCESCGKKVKLLKHAKHCKGSAVATADSSNEEDNVEPLRSGLLRRSKK